MNRLETDDITEYSEKLEEMNNYNLDRVLLEDDDLDSLLEGYDRVSNSSNIPYSPLSSYPKTKEEWWALYENHKADIYPIIFATMHFDYPAYEKAGDATTPLTGRTILEEMEHLCKTRNPKLFSYLSAGWYMTSDNKARQFKCDCIYGWNVLCDLCSEIGLLYDYEEPL